MFILPLIFFPVFPDFSFNIFNFPGFAGTRHLVNMKLNSIH